MKKYLALALLFAVPASATSLVYSPEAALLSRSQDPTAPSASAAPTSSAGAQQGWQPAALKDGGYARCNNPTGCRAFASNEVIANFGTVWMYAWNGRTAPTGGFPTGRAIGAFWPQGQYQQPGVGTEGYVDEWQGVS